MESAKQKLRELDVRPRKERGQNFLIDDLTLQKIVEFGSSKQGSNIIEIGPGLGGLTKELVKMASVTVIEKVLCDLKLGPVIPGTAFHPHANVESRLLELSMLREPRFPVDDTEWLSKVVKAAFFRRRKIFSNSLKASGRFSGKQVTRA